MQIIIKDESEYDSLYEKWEMILNRNHREVARIYVNQVNFWWNLDSVTNCTLKKGKNKNREIYNNELYYDEKLGKDEPI